MQTYTKKYPKTFSFHSAYFIFTNYNDWIEADYIIYSEASVIYLHFVQIQMQMFVIRVVSYCKGINEYLDK